MKAIAVVFWNRQGLTSIHTLDDIGIPGVINYEDGISVKEFYQLMGISIDDAQDMFPGTIILAPGAYGCMEEHRLSWDNASFLYLNLPGNEQDLRRLFQKVGVPIHVFNNSVGTRHTEHTTYSFSVK